MGWCTYFQEYGSSFYCERTNDEPSYDTIEYKCKKDGYKCSHYHISTAIGVVLRKNISDKNELAKIDETLDNIKNLRTKLEKDENYTNFIEMYDQMGPVLSEKIRSDEESLKLSIKLYSFMNRVSKFVKKGKEDKAILYYCKMVLALVKKYNLEKLYNAEADFINNKNKDAKKVLKLTKPIEK